MTEDHEDSDSKKREEKEKYAFKTPLPCVN
jgi:hypothetical protein